jgi:hypothetical protein
VDISSYLCLGLLRVLFPLNVPNETLNAVLPYPYPIHLSLSITSGDMWSQYIMAGEVFNRRTISESLVRYYTPIMPCLYSTQTMRWSLRGINILSAVRGEYRACRWIEDFLLVSAKVT